MQHCFLSIDWIFVNIFLGKFLYAFYHSPVDKSAFPSFFEDNTSYQGHIAGPKAWSYICGSILTTISVKRERVWDMAECLEKAFCPLTAKSEGNVED